MGEIEPKKMVRRSVAVALGIICIILIAGIVGIWLYYLVQDIEKDEMITNLNNEVFNKDSQISQLDSNVSNLQNQVNDLGNITILGKAQFWVQNQTIIVNVTSDYWIESANYSGYISVFVLPSDAHVRVSYSANLFGTSMNFDQENITNGGLAVFAVLPSSDILIEVSGFQGLNEAVTITYYY